MRLTKKYSITRPDTYNYCLVEHKQRGADSKSAGEEYEDVLGYHSSLASACLKALNKGIDVKNMKTILASIDKAEKEIVKAITKFGKDMMKAEA